MDRFVYCTLRVHQSQVVHSNENVDLREDVFDLLFDGRSAGYLLSAPFSVALTIMGDHGWKMTGLMPVPTPMNEHYYVYFIRRLVP